MVQDEDLKRLFTQWNGIASQAGDDRTFQHHIARRRGGGQWTMLASLRQTCRRRTVFTTLVTETTMSLVRRRSRSGRRNRVRPDGALRAGEPSAAREISSSASRFLRLRFDVPFRPQSLGISI
jgi:hypothetical protein